MSDITAIALSGLQAASKRFEDSAKRTVSDPTADLPKELVTQKTAALEFEANLKVIKTANEMTKNALDILA